MTNQAGTRVAQVINAGAKQLREARHRFYKHSVRCCPRFFFEFCQEFTDRGMRSITNHTHVRAHVAVCALRAWR